VRLAAASGRCRTLPFLWPGYILLRHANAGVRVEEGTDPQGRHWHRTCVSHRGGSPETSVPLVGLNARPPQKALAGRVGHQRMATLANYDTMVWFTSVHGYFRPAGRSTLD